MADEGDGNPTVEARPPGSGKRARVPADTDPIPLATLAETGLVRYWSGVEIARGGMGRVVEATDTLLGRTVALKEALDTDPDALRRFVRETKITARLEHPSIVPVYDAGTTAEGTPYYVMRKVSGRPLDELVLAASDLRGRLALLPHVVAATQAIAHAHERGVIHRDVKPSNILVGNLGETVVIDWGLAKVVDEDDRDAPKLPAVTVQLAGDSLHTQIGTVLGTPGFMSPEQLRSARVDARSDVYALGATLYYVLAREPPHAAATGDAMMEAASAGPPARLASRVRGVPAELATIVDKALAYDDRARYPHAGALAADLTQFLTGQLVASHRYGPIEHAARLVRRHRVAVIAVAVAAVALAVGGTIAVGRVMTARDDAMRQARDADQARLRETERADDLVLSQARLVLDRDPTAAVALVRPLAAGARWREVRAIAAGARAAGVAWRMPGPATARGVAIAPDGVHAASMSEGGVLRAYDLTARTMREVVTLNDALTQVEFLDNGRVAAWGRAARELVVVDLATARGHEVALPATPLRVVGQLGKLFWIDQDGHGWRLDPPGQPTPLPIDDMLAAVAPSPDGSRLAVCGAHGLWIVSAGPAVRVYDHATFGAAWDDDGKRVAALAGDEIVDVAVDAPAALPTRVRHVALEARSAVAIRGGVVYSSGITGLAIEDRLLADHHKSSFDLQPAGDGVVVAATDDATLSVLDVDQDLQLPGPARNLTSLAAVRGSNRVLVAASGSVFLWDLSAVLPRLLLLPDANVVYGPVGAHGLYVSPIGHDAHAIWLDLATGAQRPAPTVEAVRVLEAPDSGRVVLVSSSGDATLTRDGTSEAEPLGRDLLAVALAGSDQLVGGGEHGILVAYDLAHGTQRTLATLGSRIVAVRAAGGWAVAKTADGALARVNLAAGGPPTTLPATATARAIVVMTDGRVLIASGTQLAWWTLGGELVPYETLPQPLDDLFALDDAHAIARDTATMAYLVDLVSPRFDAIDRLPRDAVGRAHDAQLASLSLEVGARVLDVRADVSWLMARSWQHGVTHQLSRDGAYLYAMDTHGVEVWPIDLPQSAADTARWLDTLTNAHWDAATHAPEW